MFHFRKTKAKAAAARPDNLRNFSKMTEKLGLSVIPAAWPTGLAQFGRAIVTCEHCNAGEVCNDWLSGTKEHIDMPPKFCPNEQALLRAKRVKD